MTKSQSIADLYPLRYCWFWPHVTRRRRRRHRPRRRRPRRLPPNLSSTYFTAEPTTVTAGQPSSLRWSVSDASNVQIDNRFGQVSPDGRRAVYPTATTTYHLTATGAGGTS